MTRIRTRGSVRIPGRRTTEVIPNGGRRDGECRRDLGDRLTLAVHFDDALAGDRHERMFANPSDVN